jgi:hypothetical protein
MTTVWTSRSDHRGDPPGVNQELQGVPERPAAAGFTCECARAAGVFGCCDSTPNGRDARSQSHPIVRSAEQGEDWSWCYVDEAAFFGSAR